MLSHAATRDAGFVALLHVLARSLRTAQLILAEPDARAAFGFLPETWQSMLLDTAPARAADLLRRRAGQQEGATPRAHPLPRAQEEPPPPPLREPHEETPEQSAPAPGATDEDAVGAGPADDGEATDSLGAGGRARAITPAPEAETTPAPAPRTTDSPGAVVGGYINAIAGLIAAVMGRELFPPAIYYYDNPQRRGAL